MIPIGTKDERNLKISLMSYLPRYYQDSKIVNELMRVDSDELERLYAEIKKVLDQRFIPTADTTLNRWDKEFNIKNPSNHVRETKERRSLLLLQIQSMGTITKKVLKQICQIYDGGETEIIENFQNSELTIRFTSVFGTPKKLADLTVALRNVIPAHLNFKYEYRYLTWNELDVNNHTWIVIDSRDLLWNDVDNGGLN